MLCRRRETPSRATIRLARNTCLALREGVLFGVLRFVDIVRNIACIDSVCGCVDAPGRSNGGEKNGGVGVGVGEAAGLVWRYEG